MNAIVAIMLIREILFFKTLFTIVRDRSISISGIFVIRESPCVCACVCVKGLLLRVGTGKLFRHVSFGGMNSTGLKGD